MLDIPEPSQGKLRNTLTSSGVVRIVRCWIVLRFLSWRSIGMGENTSILVKDLGRTNQVEEPEFFNDSTRV